MRSEQLEAEYVASVVATNTVQRHYSGWEGYLVWRLYFNLSRKVWRTWQSAR